MSNIKQPGLFDRFTGLFAPKKSGGIAPDKFIWTELLLNSILVLAALRVVSAMLFVNRGMDLLFAVGIAAFTLSLTEGGFIVWRHSRYEKSANKTQREVAAVGMVTSFLASLAIGVSDYIGTALGEQELAPGFSGYELMVLVVGVAYAIAIIGHVLCAFLFKEFDDQVAADAEDNAIEQERENSIRAQGHAESRARVAADGLVRQAGLVSGVMANLAIAPTAATVSAVARARKEIIEKYGDFVSASDVDALLGNILIDLPELTQQAYGASLKLYLSGEDAHELGLNPERVEDAIRRATASMGTTLRNNLPTAAPAPRAQQAPRRHLVPEDMEDPLGVGADVKNLNPI